VDGGYYPGHEAHDSSATGQAMLAGSCDVEIGSGTLKEGSVRLYVPCSFEGTDQV
jgi:hypothetical protein